MESYIREVQENKKDEFCSYCSDDTVIAVIEHPEAGLEPYPSLGQINFCSSCLSKFKEELKKFDNFY